MKVRRLLPLVISSAVASALVGVSTEALSKVLNSETTSSDSHELIACGGGGGGGGSNGKAKKAAREAKMKALMELREQQEAED